MTFRWSDHVGSNTRAGSRRRGRASNDVALLLLLNRLNASNKIQLSATILRVQVSINLTSSVLNGNPSTPPPTLYGSSSPSDASDASWMIAAPEQNLAQTRRKRGKNGKGVSPKCGVSPTGYPSTVELVVHCREFPEVNRQSVLLSCTVTVTVCAGALENVTL